MKLNKSIKSYRSADAVR